MRRVDFTSWNESSVPALSRARLGLWLAAVFEEKHPGVAVVQVEARRAIVADEVSSIASVNAGSFFSIHAGAGFSDKDRRVMKPFPSSGVRWVALLPLRRAIGAGCAPHSVVRPSPAAIPVLPWNS